MPPRDDHSEEGSGCASPKHGYDRNTVKGLRDRKSGWQKNVLSTGGLSDEEIIHIHSAGYEFSTAVKQYFDSNHKDTRLEPLNIFMDEANYRTEFGIRKSDCDMDNKELENSQHNSLASASALKIHVQRKYLQSDNYVDLHRKLLSISGQKSFLDLMSHNDSGHLFIPLPMANMHRTEISSFNNLCKYVHC